MYGKYASGNHLERIREKLVIEAPKLINSFEYKYQPEPEPENCFFRAEQNNLLSCGLDDTVDFRFMPSSYILRILYPENGLMEDFQSVT